MPYADPKKRLECAQKWYEKNKVLVQTRGKKRYEENREEIISKQQKYVKEHPEMRKLWSRRTTLKASCWTLDKYNTAFSEQRGVCAICKSSETDGTLAADHDHNTMAPRELLCHLCNRGLGHFKDDPEMLEAAAAYLRKHGK